ncbi:MAG: hypothetical protein MPW15_25890 [Candidatus Manganitrophus sp.]|nr:hypothetical protein [Candidatus Manganitrophus sp.]
MEFATWLGSVMVPWIGILPIGLFFLMMISYSFSTARPLLKKVPVICPETGEPLKVLMKFNIFRNPQKIGKGLDVIHCPHFSGGEAVCSKECLLENQAQQIHRTAAEKHIEKTTMVVS